MSFVTIMPQSFLISRPNTNQGMRYSSMLMKKNVLRRNIHHRLSWTLLGLVFCGWPLSHRLSGQSTTFAVIGDFGSGSSLQVEVADLVKSWNPDFIATTGDNSYVSNYQATVGLSYQDYLDTGRFYPSIGNHDWQYPESYLAFFDLPGNELYYDVVIGDVHLFMIDNNFGWGTTVDPDEQEEWLIDALAGSTANWRFLIGHQPRPGDSDRSNYVPQELMRSAGVDAYFAGHNHYYQRTQMTDIIPSFIVGNSGRSLYNYIPGTDAPQAYYNDDHGAIRVVIDDSTITYEFWSIANGGTLVDRYSVPDASVISSGDYNRDGFVDVVDIDLQALAMKELKPYLFSYDENSDGAVNTDDREIWVHDLKNTYFGDINLDGEFRSDDLVALFTSGEFEDGVSQNSRWSTGDFDGDGEFGTSDLLVIFSDGGFNRGPRVASHTVPESESMAMIALGMLGVVFRNRSEKTVGGMLRFYEYESA